MTTADFAPSTVIRNGTNLSTVALIFDTLANVDPKSHKLTPAVAKSWKWDKAATELTIDLRSDTKTRPTPGMRQPARAARSRCQACA